MYFGSLNSPGYFGAGAVSSLKIHPQSPGGGQASPEMQRTPHKCDVKGLSQLVMGPPQRGVPWGHCQACVPVLPPRAPPHLGALLVTSIAPLCRGKDRESCLQIIKILSVVCSLYSQLSGKRDEELPKNLFVTLKLYSQVPLYMDPSVLHG